MNAPVSTEYTGSMTNVSLSTALLNGITIIRVGSLSLHCCLLKLWGGEGEDSLFVTSCRKEAKGATQTFHKFSFFTPLCFLLQLREEDNAVTLIPLMSSRKKSFGISTTNQDFKLVVLPRYICHNM